MYIVIWSNCPNDLFAEDLVGLKVSHDFEDLGEGDARILTLKDSRILDNEGVFLGSFAIMQLFNNIIQRTNFRMWRWPKRNALERIMS